MRSIQGEFRAPSLREAAVAGALLSLALAPMPGLATSPAVYDLVFQGGFTLYPAQGPGLTDELRFAGAGGGVPVGASAVQGLTYLQLDPATLCEAIVEDKGIIVTGANGEDALFLLHEGRDCLDLTSEPGVVRVHGSGSSTVTGGSGRFAGATGSGTYEVDAVVEAVGAVSAYGTFDSLRFAGTLTLP